MDRFIPKSVMKRIFSYLSYQELLRLRLVCKKFNHIIQDLLNDSLMKTNDKLRKRLNLTRRNLQNGNSNQNVIRYFKILNYLRSEVNILITSTLAYTTERCYTFTGGLIIDSYEKILAVKQDEIEAYFDYIKIFHMVESFLDHFDEKIEPEILRKHKKYLPTWFGVKLINLLDCSLDLNFNIKLSTNEDCYIMDGKYNGEELHILDNIPNLKKKLTKDCEKRAFIKSIRNNIRWNNLLYCIESSTAELSMTCFEPGVHTASKCNSVLQRKIKESYTNDQPSVSYNVSLKCKKLHLPLRANSLIQSNENLLISRGNIDILDTEDEEDPSYEFNLVMRIKTKQDDDTLKERTLKIFHVGSSCVVTEHVK